MKLNKKLAFASADIFGGGSFNNPIKKSPASTGSGMN
jgi:hypothetical protein